MTTPHAQHTCKFFRPSCCGLIRAVCSSFASTALGSPLYFDSTWGDGETQQSLFIFLGTRKPCTVRSKGTRLSDQHSTIEYRSIVNIGCVCHKKLGRESFHLAHFMMFPRLEPSTGALIAAHRTLLSYTQALVSIFMPNFFWNPLSINYFIEFILAFMVAGHFIYRLVVTRQTWRETRSTGLVALAFSAAAVSTFLQLLSILLHPDYRHFVLPWVGPTGTLAMVGYLLFSYYFFHPSGLGKRGGIVLTVALSAFVLVETAIAFERHSLVYSGIIEYRDAWVDIPVAGGFLLSVLFFAAHLTKALARDQGRPLFSSALNALIALSWPTQKLGEEATAARAFLYISLIPLALGVCLLLRSYGLIDWRVTQLLACWLFLLSIACFTLVYLNYVPEQTSFRVKVIGITLTTMLTILCSVSWLVGGPYIDNYTSAYTLPDHSAIRLSPDKTGRYMIEPIRYQFESDLGDRVKTDTAALELPFSFPFFGKHYETIFPRHAGMVGFDHPPLWRDIQHRYGPQPAIFVVTAALVEQPTREGDKVPSGLYFKQGPDHAIVTWNKLVSAFHPEAEYTFQLRLYPDGGIEMAFENTPDSLKPDIFRAHVAPMMMGIVPEFNNRHVTPVRFSNGPQNTTTPGAGVMEFHRLDFLKYLNQVYAPIAYFTVIASLMIFIIFPWFFRINLDRPLKQLIHAVEQIMDGKLATTIEVAHRDEIGFLALSFKKMAAAQHDLILTLESKVTQRAAEATEHATKNARLEERNHLSRDLHDAVNQTLFSANLIASTLPELMRQNPKQAFDAAENISKLNKEALTEMRQLLLQLRPEKLLASPFSQLLQALIEDIEVKFSIRVTLQVEGDAVLPEAVQLAFYRIAQESLINIAKHAEASQIDVFFDGMRRQAMLSVTDDGIGFDTKVMKLGHLGLQIMNERIAEVGGSLEVVSEPGKGCQVMAIWFAVEDGDPHA